MTRIFWKVICWYHSLRIKALIQTESLVKDGDFNTPSEMDRKVVALKTIISKQEKHLSET